MTSRGTSPDLLIMKQAHSQSTKMKTHCMNTLMKMSLHASGVFAHSKGEEETRGGGEEREIRREKKGGKRRIKMKKKKKIQMFRWGILYVVLIIAPAQQVRRLLAGASEANPRGAPQAHARRLHKVSKTSRGFHQIHHFKLRDLRKKINEVRYGRAQPLFFYVLPPSFLPTLPPSFPPSHFPSLPPPTPAHAPHGPIITFFHSFFYAVFTCISPGRALIAAGPADRTLLAAFSGGL